MFKNGILSEGILTNRGRLFFLIIIIILMTLSSSVREPSRRDIVFCISEKFKYTDDAKIDGSSDINIYEVFRNKLGTLIQYDGSVGLIYNNKGRTGIAKINRISLRRTRGFQWECVKNY